MRELEADEEEEEEEGKMVRERKVEEKMRPGWLLTDFLGGFGLDDDTNCSS